MWLRDSTNQLRPYLLVASENERVAEIIEGVIKKQFQCILRDPYANAFNEEENGAGHQEDLTEMKPDIWERKYEIDSLCYPVQLAYLYWKNTGKTAQLTACFWKPPEPSLRCGRRNSITGSNPLHIPAAGLRGNRHASCEGKGTPYPIPE